MERWDFLARRTSVDAIINRSGFHLRIEILIFFLQRTTNNLWCFSFAHYFIKVTTVVVENQTCFDFKEVKIRHKKEKSLMWRSFYSFWIGALSVFLALSLSLSLSHSHTPRTHRRTHSVCHSLTFSSSFASKPRRFLSCRRYHVIEKSNNALVAQIPLEAFNSIEWDLQRPMPIQRLADCLNCWLMLPKVRQAAITTEPSWGKDSGYSTETGAPAYQSGGHGFEARQVQSFSALNPYPT